MISSSSHQRLLAFLQERDGVMDTYIDVLELQRMDIETSDMDKFAEHSRMEAELIDRLEALQKVIRPLVENEGDRIASFESVFPEKCETALSKNRENQEKIRSELARFNDQMTQLRRVSARTGASWVGSSQRSRAPRYVDFEQ